MFKNIQYFDILPSTNLYLKENYQSLNNHFVVVANKQTMGRGRLGRTWNDGDDLLFSILIKDNIQNPSTLSLLVGSTLFKTLQKHVKAFIKWPNDILAEQGEKLYKIAGILLEAITRVEIDCIIIGIGINVNTTIFTDELREKASSLKLITKHIYDKKELLLDFLTIFEKDYQDYLDGKMDFVNIQKTNSCLIGKTFIQNDKIVKVIDILENGNILLEEDDKQYEKSSGEITLQTVYK